MSVDEIDHYVYIWHTVPINVNFSDCVKSKNSSVLSNIIVKQADTPTHMRMF